MNIPLGWLYEAVVALTPEVNAAKAGTVHEGHDGWQMKGSLPGRVQCGCGHPLDEIIADYAWRQRNMVKGEIIRG